VAAAADFALAIVTSGFQPRLQCGKPVGMYTRLFRPALGVYRRRLSYRVRPGISMARLVMKFGGTSVADIDRIRNVARHVKREIDAGHEVAVVVSAMAGATNKLVDWCRQASALHDAREYDVVVASGEQVTSGLLSIVLQDMGIVASSWQGWQLPIITSNVHGSARILDINGEELIKRFNERHDVAMVACFQGMYLDTCCVTSHDLGSFPTRRVSGLGVDP